MTLLVRVKFSTKNGANITDKKPEDMDVQPVDKVSSELWRGPRSIDSSNTAGGLVGAKTNNFLW